jgi:hypothetical protein
MKLFHYTIGYITKRWRAVKGRAYAGRIDLADREYPVVKHVYSDQEKESV